LLRHESGEFGTGQPVTIYDFPMGIGDGDLEDIFCQINGNGSTIHGVDSSCARLLSTWHYDAEKERGRSPSHHLMSQCG
jgi:hypothetical protein